MSNKKSNNLDDFEKEYIGHLNKKNKRRKGYEEKSKSFQRQMKNKSRKKNIYSDDYDGEFNG